MAFSEAVQPPAPAADGRVDPLYKTVAAVLAVHTSELDDDASPETISTWDSLNHLNLIMALEEAFGVSVTADDAIAMRSVGLVRQILRQYGASV